MKKILITGVNGYIGSCLYHILKNKFKIIGIDKKKSNNKKFLVCNLLNRNKLKVEDFGRGFAWLDMGTHDSLLEASQFIKTIEKQQGLKVGCLEEIGYRNGWITIDKLIQSGESLKHTSYGKYIKKLTNTL